MKLTDDHQNIEKHCCIYGGCQQTIVVQDFLLSMTHVMQVSNSQEYKINLYIHVYYVHDVSLFGLKNPIQTATNIKLESKLRKLERNTGTILSKS